MKSFVVTALFLAAASLPISAAEWQATDNKGLVEYTLQDGTARLDLVCDPEDVWTPPEFHVVVTDGGQVLQGNPVKVRSVTETLTYALSGGSILVETPETWNTLVAALSQPGMMTFSAAGQDITFTTEDELTADCTR